MAFSSSVVLGHVQSRAAGYDSFHNMQLLEFLPHWKVQMLPETLGLGKQSGRQKHIDNSATRKLMLWKGQHAGNTPQIPLPWHFKFWVHLEVRFDCSKTMHCTVQLVSEEAPIT